MEIVIATSMDPQLYLALRSNDVEKLRRLADADNNILLQRTPTGKTVLHIAAQYEHKEVGEEVCRRCTSLFTAVDSSGSSPLHEAAYYGHFQIAEALIRYAKMAPESSGSGDEQRKSQLQEMLEMKSTPPSGFTALHMAVRMGHLEVVKLFTKEEPSLLSTVDDKGISPLGYAASNGHLKIVDHILSVPIKREPSFDTCLHGQTPLHIAIVDKRLDVANMLINAIPGYATRVNDDKQTALHYAAHFGHLDIVQMLLKENGAPVYYKDKDGNFPIHVAAQMGQIGVYRELIERFPDLGDTVNDSSETVLHMAVSNNHFKLVRYILETTQQSRIINASDNNGNTALHLAVEKELIWIVFLLLDDKRVNYTLQNFEEKNPFHIMAAKMEWGHAILSKVGLIIRGAQSKVFRFTVGLSCPGPND